MVFAALSHRPCMSDGASWYFRLLHYQELVRDLPHFRFVNFVPQWPALAAILALGPKALGFAKAALDFSFSLHPIVSIGVCALFLRRRGRLDLLVFPLLSLATATQSTIANATGTVPLSLSIFWPLYLVFQLR